MGPVDSASAPPAGAPGPRGWRPPHSPPLSLSCTQIRGLCPRTSEPHGQPNGVPTPVSTVAVSRRAGFAGPVDAGRGGGQTLGLVRGGLGRGHPGHGGVSAVPWMLGLGSLLLLTDPLSLPRGTQHVFLVSCSVAWALHSQAGVTVPSVHPARRPPRLQASLPLALPCSQVWGLCSRVGTPAAWVPQLTAGLGPRPAARGCCATRAGGSLSLPAQVWGLGVLAGSSSCSVCRRRAQGRLQAGLPGAEPRSPGRAASRACNELWWFCFLDSESEKPS